jgi:methionyl-tRNA formyltransferase
VKVFSPRVADEVPLGSSEIAGAETGLPGTVVAAGATLTVLAGRGALDIGLVQPAGRRRMEAAEWVRGSGPQVGDVLG